MRIVRKIVNICLIASAVLVMLGNYHNLFVKKLYFYCLKNNTLGSSFWFLFIKYRNNIKHIDVFLFRKLNEEDRSIFIRFLLKRYCGVNTATFEEIRRIDQANEKAKSLYGKRKTQNDPITFSFKGKELCLKTITDLNCDDSTAEKVLMNYYNYTHTFVLQEYILDGYNPENGSTILDCGAANGDTMLFFKTLYPNSKIHSFECEDENIALIKDNIRLNRVKNVFLNKIFLYSATGEYGLDLQTNTILKSGYSDNMRLIQTKAIDDYVRENHVSDIGLIKFDIEGGEIEALKGAIKTIKIQKPLLYIPIYHFESDLYKIPLFLNDLNMEMDFRIKWTEKKVWGMDCVLFVKFI